MRVSNIILLVGLLVLASCSKVIKTAQHADITTNVASYPTVGDLHIASQRVSKTVSWKWNPFNTTSLKARRTNVKADLIREAGADLLVEPEFVQKTSFLNLLGGSITVTGYPATIDNFRTATPQDIVALRVAGTMKSNGSDDNIFIVIDQEDINGVVVGMSAKSQTPVAETANETSTVEKTQENPVASPVTEVVETTVNVIPGDKTVTETTTNENNSTGTLSRVSRLAGRHSNRNRLARRLSGENTSATGQENTTETVAPAPSATAPDAVIPSEPAPSSTTPSASASSTTTYEPLAQDKIAKDRYLVTMSRNYYGDPNFWPYIYEENKANFGHPDKIKVGSNVVIPNLKKYGVDPKNPADVEKAKKLAKEIYARFGA